MIRKMAMLVALAAAMSALLVACGSDEATPTQAAEATATPEPIVLRLLSAWPEGNTSTDSAVNIYGPAIEAATNGRVKIEWAAGPETVPVFEQVEPLKNGVFDMVIQTDGYNQINALAAALNLNLAPYAMHKECGVVDFVDGLYQERGGVKYFPQVHGFGNVIFLRDDVDVTAMPSLDGLTLRTYPTVDAFVKQMSGEPVVMAGGDAYTAIERGVVDGAVSGSIDFGELMSWNEVTGYITLPEIGATVANFLINLDVWNSLSPELQAGIEEGMAVASEEHFTFSKAAQESSLARMEAEGLEIVRLDTAENQEWVDAWFEATSQSTVIARDEVEGPKAVELARCVKEKLDAA